MISNMHGLARLVGLSTVVTRRAACYQFLHAAAAGMSTAALGAARSPAWPAVSVLARPAVCMSVRFYAAKKTSKGKAEKDEESEFDSEAEDVKEEKSKRGSAAQAKAEPKKRPSRAKKAVEGDEEEKPKARKSRAKNSDPEPEQETEVVEKPTKRAKKQPAVSKEEEVETDGLPDKFVLQPEARKILAQMPAALQCVETLHQLMPHTNVLLLLTQQPRLLQVPPSELKSRHAEMVDTLGATEGHVLDLFLATNPALLLDKGQAQLEAKMKVLSAALPAAKPDDISRLLLGNPQLYQKTNRVEQAVQALKVHGVKGSMVEFGAVLGRGDDITKMLVRLSDQASTLKTKGLMSKLRYPALLNTYPVLLNGPTAKLNRLAFLTKHHPESAKPHEFAQLCEFTENDFGDEFPDYAAFRKEL